MPLRARRSNCRQLFFGERRAFGGALNLHQARPQPVITKLASVSAVESSL